MIDPITFEVLRHRLSTIVDEGSATLRNISGSPSIAQSNDCNVALLTADGEGVVIGRGITSHAISCIRTARYVLREYQDNPGIGPGDMFFTNHPYIGTPHQTCGALVAPIFTDDRIVAWSGVGIHFGDVGGPVPGQVSIGAQSIWSEAIPMPPIKLVERGVLRKDIEEDFLIRCRTRVQNSVDLSAMIGTHNTIKRRLLSLVQRYGAETLMDTLKQIVSVAEVKLRSVLHDIPDGSWSCENYLDYYDQDRLDVYACRLTLTKCGDELVFDFRNSSKQAPGVINVTFGAMEGFVLRALLGLFGFAVANCPAAIERVIRIEATEGTIVHCSWPAGVCKGTTSVAQSVWHAAINCLSQMLQGSEQYAKRASATSRGHILLLDLQGNDQFGAPFVAIFAEGGATGSGANATKDGLDTGGSTEPENTIPNVESNEARYPLLYLYRRQRPDSAGVGMHRGGVGIQMAVVPHDVERIPNVMIHSHGLTFPTANGISGGYPGALNHLEIKRGTNIATLFERGIMPGELAEIESQNDEMPAPFAYTNFSGDDVFVFVGCGGGGYGDPLDREPHLVLADIAKGLVSRRSGEREYGVVTNDEGTAIDDAATVAAQTTMRTQRQLTARRATPDVLPVQLRNGARCRCGLPLHDVDSAVTNVAVRETVNESVARGNGSARATQYALREYFCYTCWTVVDTIIYVPETRP